MTKVGTTMSHLLKKCLLVVSCPGVLGLGPQGQKRCVTKEKPYHSEFLCMFIGRYEITSSAKTTEAPGAKFGARMP